jgi:ubiquinone/menaquinone biosynthesis C-methylase UbiE
MPTALNDRLEKEFNSFALHHNQGHFDPLIELLAHKFDLKDKRILEFGCGTGDFLLGLTDSQAATLIGVDISLISIQEAREKLPSENSRITFERVNLLNEIRYDGTQDILISHSVIQYLTDLNSAFERFFTTLSSGGAIFMTILQKSPWPISLFQWFGFYCFPRSIKERLHLIFQIPWIGKKLLGGERDKNTLAGESRYLGIPVVQNQTAQSLLKMMERVGFVEMEVCNAPSFSRLSAPYLLITARKP